MPRRSLLALALSLVGTTACYHAVVETGRPTGTTVVQKNWVNTFVFGLVAAQPIDVTAQCPAGVARVETQQTFLNGLVGALTFGLYTPQSATVTCAATRTGAADPRLNPAGHAVIDVAAHADAAERDAAVRAAGRASAHTGQPVFVRF
jgi:hypothetical protein